jgi:hypothetical protein
VLLANPNAPPDAVARRCRTLAFETDYFPKLLDNLATGQLGWPREESPRVCPRSRLAIS